MISNIYSYAQYIKDALSYDDSYARWFIGLIVDNICHVLAEKKTYHRDWGVLSVCSTLIYSPFFSSLLIFFFLRCLKGLFTTLDISCSMLCMRMHCALKLFDNWTNIGLN